MDKRKASNDVQIQMLPLAKQRKLSDNCSDVMNGLQFMDFEDDFTLPERTTNGGTSSTNSGTAVNGITNGTTYKQSDEVNHNNVEDLLHGIDFDSFDDDSIQTQSDFLDLTTWKRCTVEICSRDARTYDLIITGYEDKTKCDNIDQKTVITTKKMSCRLQHFWSQCKIEVGDIVSIKAIWNQKTHSYCVTNTDGFVVVRPDFLVSGTTVVGGLFCMRKAVLQERFKGIEAGMKIVWFFGFFYELNYG